MFVHAEFDRQTECWVPKVGFVEHSGYFHSKQAINQHRKCPN